MRVQRPSCFYSARNFGTFDEKSKIKSLKTLKTRPQYLVVWTNCTKKRKNVKTTQNHTFMP